MEGRRVDSLPSYREPPRSCPSAVSLRDPPGSQPPVESSEGVGKHYRHDEDARAEDEHVPVLAQTEAADTTNEQVADGKVEEAPEDIDHRGGQAHPGW